VKILYTAPNRGHHYKYALALNQAGLLFKFVSGFSRFSPKSSIDEIGDKLVRADFIQNLYLFSLKVKMSVGISSDLAYLAKKEQDFISSKYVAESDICIFYSGSGLSTIYKARKEGKITIVEAVNSHVDYQEKLLREEFEISNLSWLPFNSKEKRRRIMEYELADYILLPSEFVKRSFLDYGFPEKKLIKVPYGFNSFEKSNINDDHESKIFSVLYVGSISVRKGLKYLIEAFRQLNHPFKKLTIVGPETKITGLNGVLIPEGVVFTGVLKGEELENVYKQASVFCLPSIEEGLALVLGEALSFGLPIIATINSGAEEIITEGEEGYIVPIRDSDSILQKLQLLADDEFLYKKIRENASCKSSTLKGWENAGQALSDNLEAIFKKHKLSL